MSKAAIKTLWSAFAGTTLSLSFLLFLRTTGMEVKGDNFGLLGFKAHQLPILALPVDLVLLSGTLWLTRVWSAEVGGHAGPIVFQFSISRARTSIQVPERDAFIRLG